MSFYTSLTGLNAATTELAVTSNNIANAGTSGFKKSGADFGDIFATSPLQKASSVVGNGVSLKQVVQEFSQGNIEFSANSLDLAITGDGFFAMQSPDGTKIYTRNGGFVLNEQNQMVNSAGQSLMSLPVDSTNKADFSKPLSALTIPRKTVSEFKATTSVELGLNLPSNSQPITAAFNRNKPDTYHKTTSFTIYGASGSSHLATAYYVKTATATADDPYNKWQTYVYIDDQFVTPELIQASDRSGDQYFVNKFGEIKTASELVQLQRTSAESEKYLITTGTLYKKYSYDNLSSPIESTPATVETQVAQSSPYRDNLNLTNNQDGVDFSTFSRAQLTNMFKVSVDGSTSFNVGLEHLAGRDVKMSGTQIAFELTNQLNTRFGDGRRFDFSAEAATPELEKPGNITITKVESDGTFSELELNIREILEDIGTAEEVSLIDNDEADPEALTYAINKYLQSIDDADPDAVFKDLTIEYDFVNQGLKVTQNGSIGEIFVRKTAGEGIDPIFGVRTAPGESQDADVPDDFGTLLLPQDNDPDVILLRDIRPNGSAIAGVREQRFGISVTYSDGKFLIRSGSTGDQSSLAVSLNYEPDPATGDPSDILTLSSELALELLGIPEEGLAVSPQSSQINNVPTVRGQQSSPAVVYGKQMGVDPRRSFSVTAANRSLTVIIDGISSQIRLDPGQYSIGTFTQHLQDRINLMSDSLGRSVSGVKVVFDDSRGGLVITGSTTTDESFIQIAGHPDFGLDDIDAVFGKTSTYIELEQEIVSGGSMYVYQDKNGKWIETADKGEFDDNNIPYWTPIFLDKGELTFDTSGALVSPIGESRLESASITGTVVALDYGKSTQFNSPFAVLSQSQNGAPEGDLVGVNIGDDGLVVASYSNGSQKSLGKIIIANFATPQGLRQIGDSSFYATSESGEATYGEPGAAGFGTLRAGARERSNVDLTAELVDLITAQRNFQANAKAIETTNAMTQAIINIRG
jgi:flagellar hook-basal body protein